MFRRSEGRSCVCKYPYLPSTLSKTLVGVDHSELRVWQPRFCADIIKPLYRRDRAPPAPACQLTPVPFFRMVKNSRFLLEILPQTPMLNAVSKAIVCVSLLDSQNQVRMLANCWRVCTLSDISPERFVWGREMEADGIYVHLSQDSLTCGWNESDLSSYIPLTGAFCVFPWHKGVLIIPSSCCKVCFNNYDFFLLDSFKAGQSFF